MPYKDVQRKREWERLHRHERLARRRQLRSIEAARKQAEPELRRVEDSRASLLVPMAAGAALAGYNPALAIGVGSMTLLVAALYKKSWAWWIVGVLILITGLFFEWNKDDTEK
jgi:hypothetical protein